MIQKCQGARASGLIISWQDSHSQAEEERLQDWLGCADHFVFQNILCFPVLYIWCLFPSLSPPTTSAFHLRQHIAYLKWGNSVRIVSSELQISCDFVDLHVAFDVLLNVLASSYQF